MPNSPLTKSSPMLTLLAWAIVVIPTSWGMGHTVQNALKIFAAPSPAASQQAPSVTHAP